MNNSIVLDAAHEWYDAGCSVAPAKEDGSKTPDVKSWTEFQTKRICGEDLPEFMDTTGLVVFTGHVFKNDHTGFEDYEIELLEFDSDPAYNEFRQGLKDAGLDGLFARIETGYLERTPSGGVHLFYFTPTVGRNTVLAQELTGETDKNGNPKPKTLIETRGHGGLVVVAPSYGGVHPSGEPYERVQGSPATIAHITTEEREALFAYARTFDRMPERARSESSRDSTGRAGSTGSASRRVQKKFNKQATWDGILTPYGWQRIGESDDWRRPGAETTGKDATTNADGTDRLWVHSTSSVFDTGRYYTKFQTYAVLNHDGDHAAAEADIDANWDAWEAAWKSESEQAKPRFQFETILQFRKRPAPEWLIDGVIQAGSLTMLYGGFGSYKSFLARDLTLSTATGIDWHGCNTHQGPTAYIVGEGGGQFGKRVDAWLKFEELNNMPDFYLLTDAPQLNTDRDLKALIDAVKAIPKTPVLMVIDTLARTFDGNENTQEDMNRYIKAAGELQKLGMAVVIVHHTGKDGKYRGSSALPGAADTIIRIDRKGSGVRVKCEKQKDSEEFRTFNLKRRIVTLSEPPSDPDVIDLNAVTSLVFTREDPAPDAADDLADGDIRKLKVLIDAGDVGLTYTEWLKACGTSKSTFTDARRRLVEGGYVKAEPPFAKRPRFTVTELGRKTVGSATERSENGPSHAA